MPAAIEMMDRLTIEAAEKAVAPGYPPGAGAVLLVELEGVAAQVDEDAVEIERICRECGSFEIRAATDETSRALLWKGRKSAFAAMGRVATDYYVQDGVVPRTRLPDVLRRIEELSETHGLRVGNVFHAGDGNLHPLVLYDAAQGESERARELAEAILDACLEVGGSLTDRDVEALGEVGRVARRATFVRVRRAFDPDGICNPGKVIPTPRLCGEVPGPYRVHPLERVGVAERL